MTRLALAGSIWPRLARYGCPKRPAERPGRPAERPGSPWLARSALAWLDLAAPGTQPSDLGEQPSDLARPGWLDPISTGWIWLPRAPSRATLATSRATWLAPGAQTSDLGEQPKDLARSGWFDLGVLGALASSIWLPWSLLGAQAGSIWVSCAAWLALPGSIWLPTKAPTLCFLTVCLDAACLVRAYFDSSVTYDDIVQKCFGKNLEN